MKVNRFKKLSGQGLKIAIVRARFNESITGGLLAGAKKALLEAGVKAKDIFVFEAPGSVEIPLLCQRLARAKKYHGLVALGAVIKGETAHFEHVARLAADGILTVMLKANLPIAFGVLIAYNPKQAQTRAQNNSDNKGREAALALVEQLVGLKKIRQVLKRKTAHLS